MLDTAREKTFHLHQAQTGPRFELAVERRPPLVRIKFSQETDNSPLGLGQGSDPALPGQITGDFFRPLKRIQQEPFGVQDDFPSTYGAGLLGKIPGRTGRLGGWLIQGQS
jgi:hypothetical protein